MPVYTPLRHILPLKVRENSQLDFGILRALHENKQSSPIKNFNIKFSLVAD